MNSIIQLLLMTDKLTHENLQYSLAMKYIQEI